MKTLDKILNNGWHKHFPIGGLVITVLLFLATFSESLRYVEELLICFSIAAMGYYAFELWQDRKNPIGSKQSNKIVLWDVLVSVFGSAFVALFNIHTHLSGNYTLQIVVLILLLSAGFGLEVYRRKRIKKDKLIS